MACSSRLLASVIIAILAVPVVGDDKVLTFTRFSARLGANLNQFLFCMAYAERKRYHRVVFPRIGASIEQVRAAIALSKAQIFCSSFWYRLALFCRNV